MLPPCHCSSSIRRSNLRCRATASAPNSSSIIAPVGLRSPCASASSGVALVPSFLRVLDLLRPYQRQIRLGNPCQSIEHVIVQPSREGYQLLLDELVYQIARYAIVGRAPHLLGRIELASLEYRDQAPDPVRLLELGPGNLGNGESVILPVLQVIQSLDIAHHAVALVSDLDGLPLPMQLQHTIYALRDIEPIADAIYPVIVAILTQPNYPDAGEVIVRPLLTGWIDQDVAIPGWLGSFVEPNPFSFELATTTWYRLLHVQCAPFSG